MSTANPEQHALPPEGTITTVRGHVSGQRERIHADLAAICAIPGVFPDPEGTADGPCARAADWTARALAEAGLEVSRVPTPDGSEAVIGRREGDPDLPRILLYSHYDVVPVNDAAAWTTPPFELTEREGRWYARGAADCKGNLVAHLAALRTVAEVAGGDAGRLNLTVLVEGSEEAGGAGLDALIAEHPGLFAADVILIADTGNTAAGVPTLTTRLRGGAQLDVTVRTLHQAGHSGQVGGAAPDAVAALMRALDSLRDDAGRTVIDGVDCRGRWEGAEYPREDFRRDAALLDGAEILGGPDSRPADLLWARPAVTVTGFSSTPVEKAVNAVPAVARARVNLRVPAGMDAAATADALARHIRAHVPWGAECEVEVPECNEPFATDETLPAARALAACLSAAYDGAATVAAGSGGSIPLTVALREAHPNAEIALFGVEEPRCAIHSVDESVDPSEILAVAAAEALFLLGHGLRGGGADDSGCGS